jgi:hypothetical protein
VLNQISADHGKLILMPTLTPMVPHPPARNPAAAAGEGECPAAGVKIIP